MQNRKNRGDFQVTGRALPGLMLDNVARSLTALLWELDALERFAASQHRRLRGIPQTRGRSRRLLALSQRAGQVRLTLEAAMEQQPNRRTEILADFREITVELAQSIGEASQPTPLIASVLP